MQQYTALRYAKLMTPSPPRLGGLPSASKRKIIELISESEEDLDAEDVEDIVKHNLNGDALEVDAEVISPDEMVSEVKPSRSTTKVYISLKCCVILMYYLPSDKCDCFRNFQDVQTSQEGQIGRRNNHQVAAHFRPAHVG